MANTFLAASDMAVLMRGHATADADAASKDRRFDVREAVMAKIPAGATVSIWALCAALRTEIGASFTEVSIAVGELRDAGRLCGSTEGYRRKG